MADQREIVIQRTVAAIAAMKQRMSDEDSSVSLYISHHLDEIEDAYWLEQTGKSRPSAEQVINLLTLRPDWDEEPESIPDLLDFTLPSNVTDYVLAVRFDEAGEVEDVDMES